MSFQHYLQSAFPDLAFSDAYPGCLCKFCMSDNVDVGAGKWRCNACEAEGTLKMKITVRMTKKGKVPDLGGTSDDSTATHGDGSRWDEL